jgi:hypothetical protein
MTIYKEGPNKKGYEFQNRNIYENPQFIEAVKKYATSGGGLEGTQYVYVAANGTDVENAAELQAAYDKAATMITVSNTWIPIGISGAMDFGSGEYDIYFNPFIDYFTPLTTYTVKINGIEYTATTVSASMFNAYFQTNAPSGLTITSFEVLNVEINRVTVIVSPGNYNFESSTFNMNVQGVNLVSLDGNRSIIFNSSNNLGTLNLTANNVYLKGVDTQLKPLSIGNSLDSIEIVNCKGGSESFGFLSSIVNGTFIDCEGGNNSFGGTFTSTVSGIFINCIASNNSFGSTAVSTSSGSFTNCIAGFNSFGKNSTGIFTNCISKDDSFGFVGTASGTFYNCKGNSYLFGYAGTSSGTFYNCIAGSLSFGGNGGDMSGNAFNCIGGSDSFGGSAGTLTGSLYYCKLTSGNFQTVSGSGITRLCIDGSNVENNQG